MELPNFVFFSIAQGFVQTKDNKMYIPIAYKQKVGE